MKTCTKCGEAKPIEDFHFRSARPENHERRRRASWCKPCTRANQREAMRRRSEREPERVKAVHRRHVIKKRFGLTVAEYEKLMLAGCAICGGDADGLDHDHATGDARTGQVREPLCMRCNIALGQMRDDPALLRAAAEYLERHARSR